MATTITYPRVAGTQTEKVSNKKLLWAAPLVGVLAAALNTLVYFMYRAVGFNIILPLPNPADPSQLTTPLPLEFVVLGTLVGALAAGTVLWALNQFTARPRTLFIVISAIALVLSFGLSLPLEMPVSFKLGLDAMHVLAANVIVGGLTRWTREV